MWPFTRSKASKTANILDPIHDTLDPRMWDNPASPEPTLKSEHSKFIHRKIYSTLEEHGYDGAERWLKLVLTGSLTTYQYSDLSDCDVSLFIDSTNLPEWSRAEMIGIMVQYCDGTIVPGTPFPLQDYVVSRKLSPQDLYKPGLRSGYDLATDKWIVPPDKSRVHDVEAEYNLAYTQALEAADKMDRLLKFEPLQAARYWHTIHKKRMRDMQHGLGDFSNSNIVYKMLANRGYFTRLEALTGEHIARHATLHDSSGIVDHTYQPLSEVPQGRERMKRSQSSSWTDHGDGTPMTIASDHSHTVRTFLPAPSSTDESELSSALPAPESSSSGAVRMRPDDTSRFSSVDTSPDILYTEADSRPSMPADDRTRSKVWTDDSLNKSSHSLNARNDKNFKDSRERWQEAWDRYLDRPTQAERVPIEAMKPYREFNRDIDAEQYTRDLRDHIAQHGMTEAIKLEYNPETGNAHIGEGNHRLTIAEELGMSHVPVEVLRSGRNPSSLHGYSGAPLPQPPVPDQNGYSPGLLRPSEVGLPTVEDGMEKGSKFEEISELTGEHIA